MSNGVRILWVDDEIDLLKPHILFLKGKGYEVETANNAYDAIDMVGSHPYDLIILDEMMPGMTGLETLPKIKEIRPTTPVIMVTKSEEENIMDKAVGSKIADYLISRLTPIRCCCQSKRTFTVSSWFPSRAWQITAVSLVKLLQHWDKPEPLRIGLLSINGW